MNKLGTKEIVLFVLGLLVVIALLFLFFKKDKVYWGESYRHEEKQPYDFALFENLTKILDKNNSVEILEVPFSVFQKNIRKSANKTKNVFIHNGNYSALDFENTDSLLSFAKLGNKVFIIGNNQNDIRKTIGALNGFSKKSVNIYNNNDTDETIENSEITDPEVVDSVALEEETVADTTTDEAIINDSSSLIEIEQKIDTIVQNENTSTFEENNNSINWEDTLHYTDEINYVSFFNDSCVNYSFKDLNSNKNFRFCFIDDFKNYNRQYPIFIDSTLSILHNGQKFTKVDKIGFVNNKPMFVRYTIGKGEIYLCLDPILLTNYFLSKPEGYDFVNSFFGSTDDYQFFQNKYHNYFQNNDEINRSYSAFTYITSQEALRWAFYLTLILLVVFFLFFSKRRQNIIPVHDLKENSTIEYAETISRLYQSKNSNADIVEIMSKNFQKFILHKYSLRQKPNDDTFVPKLSKLSGIKPEEIESILKLTEKYVTFKSEVTTQILNTYYNKISNFYKNCK